MTRAALCHLLSVRWSGHEISASKQYGTKANYFEASPKLLPVAGDTSRAGHVLFGPGSLVGIDDLSTALQAHGS